MKNLELLIENLNDHIKDNNDEYQIINIVLQESEEIRALSEMVLELNEEEYSYFSRA